MLTIDAFYAGLWWRQPQLFPSLSVQNPQPRGQVFQRYRTPSTICNFLYLYYIWVSPTGETGGGGGALGSIPSVSPFVCPLGVRSLSFRTFLSRPFIYLLEILYKNLSWYIYSTTSTFVAFDQLLRELLQEAKSQCPLPSLCFFEPIGKSRWPHWPLIGWDIFDFSAIAERNSTKLDKKQDFILLLLSLCFSRRSEKQDGCPDLWLAETFSTSSLKQPNRIQRNLTGSMILTPSTKFVGVFFRAHQKKKKKNKMAALASVLAETFSTSSLKSLNGILTKLDRK